MPTFQYYPGRPSLSKPQLNEKIFHFKSVIHHPRSQFFYTFERGELIANAKALHQNFSHKKFFYHLGIGGSSLGPEMLIHALKKNETQFVFINNIDPEALESELSSLNHSTLNESLFFIVSKSGNTIETMAGLSIITQKLANLGVSAQELKNYMVFATDPEKSEMLTLAQDFSIPILSIPSDVGGRFSVLTPVGFFPALFAGINIDELCLGAKEMQSQLLNEDPAINELMATSEFLYHLKMQKNVNQTVFMPYSTKLRFFSNWFAQLWAESLGKKKNQRGMIVNEGLTPIVAYGATDQHSLLQLFVEGPEDKAFIILDIDQFKHDFSLTSPYFETPTFNVLKGTALSKLMKAEVKGTINSLKECERPILQISLEENNEYVLGQLILFFESLTALMGQMLDVDPFNQPGVEASKIYTRQFLKEL